MTVDLLLSIFGEWWFVIVFILVAIFVPLWIYVIRMDNDGR